jgi:AP-1-like factor
VNGAVHQAGPTSEILSVSKLEAEENRRQASNSEDDDLTPAQSRRKAQNRAAQRAFRERKERHVKDLESRLNELEQAQTEAVSENERLKRDLQKMETENEILRATSMVAPSAGSPAAAAPTTTGPMTYNPTDFYSNVLQGHANKSPSHRVVTSEKGERLLAAGATWEVIVNHELFKRGLVDVSAVSERLKPQAKCDGQGPVFEESAILEAIELSVAENSDELI